MSSIRVPFGGNKANESPSAKIMSAMFITTKFRAYNAEGFKRFAITVNAALKRLTSEKVRKTIPTSFIRRFLVELHS